MTARLHVDWTACEARGSCIELLPHLLTEDDWGYPLARGGTREVALTVADVPDAEEAVRLCPRLALSLSRDT